MKFESNRLGCVVCGLLALACGFGNVIGAIVGAMILVLTHVRLTELEHSPMMIAMATSGGLVVTAIAAKMYYGMVAKLYASRHGGPTPDNAVKL